MSYNSQFILNIIKNLADNFEKKNAVLDLLTETFLLQEGKPSKPDQTKYNTFKAS